MVCITVVVVMVVGVMAMKARPRILRLLKSFQTSPLAYVMIIILHSAGLVLAHSLNDVTAALAAQLKCFFSLLLFFDRRNQH